MGTTRNNLLINVDTNLISIKVKADAQTLKVFMRFWAGDFSSIERYVD